ncbi:hypothetical protein OR1_02070 [Geobacter sp. OR-1]|uniref:hypothetical protein n=1 Tax=Geobacter sp. OR-1 TaxID=1266765 RepID=UPI0005439C89|nr:hypothetical protein [Geobacter sp. OR-1]GAM09789.1 hypothetical protein OR1_02070 [Geobacter sp. OR-1]
MIEDDHYVVNTRNAHIDTSDFQREVRKVLTDNKCGINEALECIYDIAFLRTGTVPQEPDHTQLICRYLSPSKFIQFLHTRSISFPTATQFSDHWECRVPEDYETAVLRILYDLNMSADDWSSLVRRKAEEWNISCWTQLDNHFDDHLMWDCYAGGPQGVGITVRYGVLKDSLANSVKQLDVDSLLHCGSVNYETLSLLPFNKHHMFRNENEVRFAFRARHCGALSVSIDDIFGSFGIRISPAATVEHHDAMRSLWLKYGGVDRVQWPQ